MSDEPMTMEQVIQNVAKAIAREDGWNERRVLGTRYRRHARAAVKEIMLAHIVGAVDVTSELEERMCRCGSFWTDRNRHDMSHPCHHVRDVLDSLATMFDERAGEQGAG